MDGTIAYFAEGPKSLASSCDIVLVLDDGVRLPAHLPVLARLSPVFSDMLDDGPLSRASRDSPVEVPLSECSTDEAIHFLSVLYSVNGSKSTGAAHLSTARLAHKYGMQVYFHHQRVSVSFPIRALTMPLGVLLLKPGRTTNSPYVAGCCGLMR